MMYTEVKIAWKKLRIFKKARNGDKYDKYEINMLKIKNIIKLGTIVFIQGNIELLHVSYLNPIKFCAPLIFARFIFALLILAQLNNSCINARIIYVH